MPGKKGAATYEAAFRRLEEITKQLEEGDLALNQSIKLYEEGVSLYAACSKMLDEAQGGLSVLGQPEEKNEEETEDDV